MLLSIFENWSFMGYCMLFVLKSVAGKVVNDVFTYILNDILFVQGQADDYCHGTRLKSYYLSEYDYIKLLIAQLVSVFTVIVIIPVHKFNSSVFSLFVNFSCTNFFTLHVSSSQRCFSDFINIEGFDANCKDFQSCSSGTAGRSSESSRRLFRYLYFFEKFVCTCLRIFETVIVQRVALRASLAAMLSVFQFSIHSRSSFSAPMKFVPLSDQIIAGVPRRETNRSTPILQELVSMDGTTSTWTARVVRQVKRNPHLFSVVRRTVT